MSEFVMGTVTKFKCQSCGGIVATEFDDELVQCGHCGGVCQVPRGFEPGIVIDDFAIEKLIGQGGMGNVYLAHQFSLDREVALKILKAKFLEDPKFKNEFVNEARSVASLNHPNIIRAFKVGVDEGTFFFAMEFVEGQTLSEVMKVNGLFSQDQVIEIGLEMAEALGYAWTTSRMIHRDIKPDNIMLTTEGVSKLMDMGLSRRGDENFADDGDMISGTPQYISPEQIMGEGMDIRGDFYSLGATMYQLLSGRFIFDGTLEEMIKKHMTEKPIPLKKFVPAVSDDLARVIHKLLAKKPESRYQDSAELIADLRKAKKRLSAGSTSKRFVVKPAVTSTTRSRGGSPSSSGIRRPTKSSIDVNEKQTIKKGSRIKDSRRDRDRGHKKEQKDPTTKILIIVGAVVLLIGLITLISLAGGKETPSNKPSGTDNTASKSAPKTNEVALDPEEKKAMNSPNLKKALETSGLLRGLDFKFFKGKFTSCNDLQNATPKKTGYVRKLDLFERTGGNSDFGFIWEGYLAIPKTAEYTFYTKTDDGSRLYVADELVVDNDGLHGFTEKNGRITLEKGIHKFRLEYFQAGSTFGFEAKVKNYKYEKQDIYHKWFRRDISK